MEDEDFFKLCDKIDEYEAQLSTKKCSTSSQAIFTFINDSFPKNSELDKDS